METPREHILPDWKPTTPEETAAVRIISILRAGGAEAYIAGGYVRDAVRSHISKNESAPSSFNPHDVDIAVNLPYENVRTILGEHGFIFVETGKNFTVLNVIVQDDNKKVAIEVAQFRTDGSYGPDKKPQEVHFTPNIREDAARRDFTINGLYFDPTKKKIVDYVGGIDDLESNVLRPIGDPYQRLVAEDPIRMLRYVRFRSKFGMKFSPAVQDVIEENSGVLTTIPPERIKGETGELDKILTLRRSAFAVADLERLGILEKILPEVSALKTVDHTPPNESAQNHTEGDVLRHTLEVLRATDHPAFREAVQKILSLPPEFDPDTISEAFYKRYGSAWAWAALLHDTGKKETQTLTSKDGRTRYQFIDHEKKSADYVRAVAQRLKFSNEETAKILFLVENHMRAHTLIGPHAMRISKRNTLLRHAYAEELLFLKLADDMGTFAPNRPIEKKIDEFHLLWSMLQKIRTDDAARNESPLMRNSTKRIYEIFVGKSPDGKKGAWIIGLVKDILTQLIDEGICSAETVDTALMEIKGALDVAGIEYQIAEGWNIREKKQSAHEVLMRHFKLSE